MTPRAEAGLNDTQLQLLGDLHRQSVRQGPGGEPETRRALELAGLDRSRPLRIADIGCGTGASTILLARELDAAITAVDCLPLFLQELRNRAQDQGVGEKVTTLSCSMDSLPFADEEFDVIWSEGAVYNIGYENGVSAWSRYLKPGGKLIVSEITWLRPDRPQELQAHWEREYPEIDMASVKIGILEKHGYSLNAYFALPPRCWLENYYMPLRDRFEGFLRANPDSADAEEIVAQETREIALYEGYGDYYSYGMYIAEKIGASRPQRKG